MATLLFTVTLDTETNKGMMLGNCSAQQAIVAIQSLAIGAARADAERKSKADGGSKLTIPSKALQGKLFPPN